MVQDELRILRVEVTSSGFLAMTRVATEAIGWGQLVPGMARRAGQSWSLPYLRAPGPGFDTLVLSEVVIGRLSSNLSFPKEQLPGELRDRIARGDLRDGPSSLVVHPIVT